MAHLLAMTKPSGGTCFIEVGEKLYQLTSCILCLQFCDAFATHFSPHKFKVAIRGGCEVVIHDIKYTLDLQLN
jgi:hypothetical protein